MAADKDAVPELMGTPEAREVAAATRDLRVPVRAETGGSFLPRFPVQAGEGRLSPALPPQGANIGYRSRDMMRLIPGTTIKLVERCSGHDGTWAMKREFFPLAMLTGKSSSPRA